MKDDISAIIIVGVTMFAMSIVIPRFVTIAVDGDKLTHAIELCESNGSIREIKVQMSAVQVTCQDSTTFTLSQ
jgi:hypothetical protein